MKWRYACVDVFAWNEDMHVVWVQYFECFFTLFLLYELSLFFFLHEMLSKCLDSNTLWEQLLLQFSTDRFETFRCFLHEMKVCMWFWYNTLIIFSHFLAHLSRRLTRWAYSIPMVHRLSIVRCRPHFQTWISLRPVDQTWSNFMYSITGMGEILHKVLGQIGSKLWFPWQQKAPSWLIMGKTMSPAFLGCCWSNRFYTCR